VHVHLLAALAAAVTLQGFTTAATEPDGGQLLTGTFPGSARPGYVYLPPGFDAATRYPVVYLLHGMPGSPSEYTDALSLGTYADAQIASGALQPFIAVVPAAGADPAYDGEWAGPWARMLADRIVPWVDANLPTIASPAGRVIAGLSAGGFGAFEIALQHPGLFGRVESWSGYFSPLRDGPFKDASAAALAAADPTLLVRQQAPALRSAGVRFFVTTGPYHSHWIPRGTTQAFVALLRSLRLPVTTRVFPTRQGEWVGQFDAGLAWAFASRKGG